MVVQEVGQGQGLWHRMVGDAISPRLASLHEVTFSAISDTPPSLQRTRSGHTQPPGEEPPAPSEQLPSLRRAGKCGQGEQEFSHLGEAMGTEGAPPAPTAQAVGT